MVTPRERGHYQAYMGAAWMAAGVAGPALGGIIADHLHWSMIFWLNVPLGLLTAFLLNRSMKKLPRAGRKHKLDFLGAALMMAAATLLLLALTTGGTRVPWTVADHCDAGGWLGPAHGGRDLVAQARTGAVPAPAVLANPVHAAWHRGDKLRHGRADRPHDLHAALFPDGAQAHADSRRGSRSSR